MCSLGHSFIRELSLFLEMLSNSEISLNWSIIDEVTTGNTTSYIFLAHSVCDNALYWFAVLNAFNLAFLNGSWLIKQMAS